MFAVHTSDSTPSRYVRCCTSALASTSLHEIYLAPVRWVARVAVLLAVLLAALELALQQGLLVAAVVVVVLGPPVVVPVAPGLRERTVALVVGLARGLPFPLFEQEHIPCVSSFCEIYANLFLVARALAAVHSPAAAPGRVPRPAPRALVGHGRALLHPAPGHTLAMPWPHLFETGYIPLSFCEKHKTTRLPCPVAAGSSSPAVALPAHCRPVVLRRPPSGDLCAVFTGYIPVS